jgi:hypothetical protein
MTISLVVNGSTYPFPEVNDVAWGQEVVDWTVAITNSTLQKTGGLFTLQDELYFGAGYGLKSLYYKSSTANVATAGQIRLAKTDSISFRNNTNTANLNLSLSNTDTLLFNGLELGGGGVSCVEELELIDTVSSNLIYIGQAAIGSLGSTAVWRIERVTITGSIIKKEYANGVSTYTNIWDNRASLSYS